MVKYSDPWLCNPMYVSPHRQSRGKEARAGDSILRGYAAVAAQARAVQRNGHEIFPCRQWFTQVNR